MEVKIKPRKATDRGGYYCMPLYSNIPQGRRGVDACTVSRVWCEMLAEPAGRYRRGSGC